MIDPVPKEKIGKLCRSSWMSKEKGSAAYPVI